MAWRVHVREWRLACAAGGRSTLMNRQDCLQRPHAGTSRSASVPTHKNTLTYLPPTKDPRVPSRQVCPPWFPQLRPQTRQSPSLLCEPVQVLSHPFRAAASSGGTMHVKAMISSGPTYVRHARTHAIFVDADADAAGHTRETQNASQTPLFSPLACWCGFKRLALVHARTVRHGRRDLPRLAAATR